MRYAAAVLVLALTASPALADAVTYKGTLGKLPIIVELADPASGAELGFGRYAYLNKGIDIPLDQLDAKAGRIAFVEQLPCTDDTCALADDGSGVANPPLGATWELAADGDALTGTWTDGDKSLPIQLTRVGSRTVDPEQVRTASDLADVYIGFLFEDGRMTSENDPYDWEKMQVNQTVSDETNWDGMRFQYLADPRVGLAFPRIVSAGDTPLSDSNAYLEARQFSMNADALNCRAKVYAGMGYMGDGFGGTLAGWDEETVTVTYLSPTILAWTEAGSLWCGGAYPENHADYYSLDLATGQPLDLSKIFRDWMDRPSQELVDFIGQSRTPGRRLGGRVRHRRSDRRLSRGELPAGRQGDFHPLRPASRNQRLRHGPLHRSPPRPRALSRQQRRELLPGARRLISHSAGCGRCSGSFAWVAPPSHEAAAAAR